MRVPNLQHARLLARTALLQAILELYNLPPIALNADNLPTLVPIDLDWLVIIHHPGLGLEDEMVFRNLEDETSAKNFLSTLFTNSLRQGLSVPRWAGALDLTTSQLHRVEMTAYATLYPA